MRAGSSPSVPTACAGSTPSTAPGLQDVDEWLDRFRRFWAPPLAALATEIERGKRALAATEEQLVIDGDDQIAAVTRHGRARPGSRSAR